MLRLLHAVRLTIERHLILLDHQVGELDLREWLITVLPALGLAANLLSLLLFPGSLQILTIERHDEVVHCLEVHIDEDVVLFLLLDVGERGGSFLLLGTFGRCFWW